MRVDDNRYIFEQICSLDNLFSVWKKIEREFSFHDVWYDELSFKRFKFNLRNELTEIQKQLLEGSYELDGITPIPFPKKGCDKIRQAFRISVRDQVVWVAVCNILGPIAEPKMPAWSFGNRLYLPMWKVRKQNQAHNAYSEITEDPKYVWKNGKFINSSFRLYMPWNRSWPRFRHLLTATLKKMAFVPLEASEEEYVSTYSEVDDWLRLRYLNDGYFPPVEIAKENLNKDEKKVGKKTKRKIFWASIDITQFYPHVRMSRLLDMIMWYCNLTWVDSQTGEVLCDNRMLRLLTALTSFRIIDDESLSNEELLLMGLVKGKLHEFDGLPTGLLVGGWLANIYLLDTDLKIASRLEKEKGIAHFRYVDDHTFVSLSPKKLVKWVSAYIDELSSFGLEINEDKFTPNPLVSKYREGATNEDEDEEATNEKISLSKIVLTESWPEEFLNDESNTDNENWKEYSYYIKKIEKKCEIDPLFPTPLMTQTLEKISQIGSLDLALLSRHETKMVEHDLKTLIVADLPDEEIKEDTRVSFASTFLSRIIISSSMDYHKLKALRSAWVRKCGELKTCLLSKLILPQIESNIDANVKIKDELRQNIDSLISEVFDIPSCGNKEWKIKKFVYPYPDDYNISDEEKRIQTEANQIGDAINSLYIETTEKISHESNRVFNLLVKAANKVPDKG
ncbi:MAG: RNA-directed DNA polymerase [Muribaculum sp.]|nr:RNA-directed DNA polymerase [Muribaculum sp.]